MTAVDSGPCGRRSLSGLSVCDQPAGHTGMHIDSAQDTSFQIHAGPHDPGRANPPSRLALDDDVIVAWRLPIGVRELDLLREAVEANHQGATISQTGQYLLVRQART
jgi:hypothetical protein